MVVAARSHEPTVCVTHIRLFVAQCCSACIPHIYPQHMRYILPPTFITHTMGGLHLILPHLNLYPEKIYHCLPFNTSIAEQITHRVDLPTYLTNTTLDQQQPATV